MPALLVRLPHISMALEGGLAVRRCETRYYKMRCMKDDKAIGLESDVVKVVVDIA
ncbi:MAG TPA: hypothetical protein VI757_05680 [Bacteroidia bacterium]|nr:hypothetical protein [Bacteroidia bacterium]